MPAKHVVEAEFHIPMRGEYVSLVRKSIRSLAASSGFADSDCDDIEVAVGEAVTNAVSHGRPAEGPGRVRATCRVTQSDFVVDVEDPGGTTCVPAPKPPPSKNNEHGRGWLLIHRLMDQVSVRCTKRGMLVSMVKRLPMPESFGGHKPKRQNVF